MSDQTNIAWTEATWNPWYGCTKVSAGCDNCLAPDTHVLYGDLTWRPIGDAEPGDVLVGFDEHAQPGGPRKARSAVVEVVRWSRQPSRRLLTDSTAVITTADHRWLRSRSHHWPTTDRLRVGKPLRNIGPVEEPTESEDYRVGYLAGMTWGDGTFRYEPGWGSVWRKESPQCYWRVALADHEPLGRLVSYLAQIGIHVRARSFSSGSAKARRPMQCVELRSQGALETLHPLLTQEKATYEWARGFLAGIFDAEGSTSGGSLRIAEKDIALLERLIVLGRRIGFTFQLEARPGAGASTVRLVGGLREQVRFFARCRPSISRKAGFLYGACLETAPDMVCAVEAGPVVDVVDIQTSTGTFYAQGLATHNCYMFREQRQYGNDPEVVRRSKTKFAEPLRWKEPRRVFTCSWSDWFHKDADAWRDEAWAIIRATPQHTYQILTKRPGRIARHLPADWGEGYQNVWLGVSIESQTEAFRARQLLEVPAAIHWVSCEPLIGPLSLADAFTHWHTHVGAALLDWVVVGGESGPDGVRREMDLAWAWALKDECEHNTAAFFFKQRSGRTSELTDGVPASLLVRKYPTTVRA